MRNMENHDMAFRKLGLIALAGGLLAAPLAFAEDKKDDSGIPGEFTFTLSLTSDYTFRGISQTDSGPAIQGTIDYAYMFRDEIGVYAGIFGSNVDFDETSGPGVNRASAEFDLYGGVKGTISGVTWQLGTIYYAYPSAHPSSDFDYDYQEIVVKLGYDFDFMAITAGVNYAWDYFSETGTGVYWNADVTVPLPFLPLETKALAHIGHQSIEDNARFGAPDYTDWMLGISTTYKGFTLTAAYVDTSINKGECFAGTGLTNTCKARGVLTLSKTF
jgi:uncharacterized protein (TIGR02001 family)